MGEISVRVKGGIDADSAANPKHTEKVYEDLQTKSLDVPAASKESATSQQLADAIELDLLQLIKTRITAIVGTDQQVADLLNAHTPAVKEVAPVYSVEPSYDPGVISTPGVLHEAAKPPPFHSVAAGVPYAPTQVTAAMINAARKL